MCGAHVLGTSLQGTQLQRISFRLSTAWSTRGPAKRRSSLVTTTPPLISRALQENLCGNAVTVAGREIVEGEGGDQILREATGADIAFLVVGHPFG